jgi:hypothetical protein
VCDVHGELMLSMTLVGGFAWKIESAVARFFRKHLGGVEGAPSRATRRDASSGSYRLNGRALAQTAGVQLDANAITIPASCTHVQ